MCFVCPTVQVLHYPHQNRSQPRCCRFICGTARCAVEFSLIWCASVCVFVVLDDYVHISWQYQKYQITIEEYCCQCIKCMLRLCSETILVCRKGGCSVSCLWSRGDKCSRRSRAGINYSLFRIMPPGIWVGGNDFRGKKAHFNDCNIEVYTCIMRCWITDGIFTYKMLCGLLYDVILVQCEDEEDSGIIKYSKFEPMITRVLQANRFRSESEEQIAHAFKVIAQFWSSVFGFHRIRISPGIVFCLRQSCRIYLGDGQCIRYA